MKLYKIIIVSVSLFIFSGIGFSQVIDSVSSTATDGTYNISDVISIRISFSENVNVTGTPQLTLETGTTDRVVNYASGSGTSKLTFNYTVQAGDLSADLDYVATGSLSLNSGTILAVDDSNPAVLTLPSPGAAGSLGANKALVIDGIVPTVSSVSSSTADGTYNISDVIAVTVTFSENVTVTGTPQITLETGTTDRVVDYTSGTGTTTLTFNYTVQSGDVSSDLDYTTTGALALNSGTILDGAGNAATLTLASPGAAGSLGANKALVIDGIVPTVSSVSSSTADGTYNISDVIAVTVTFSENVTVTGTPQITLETGTTDRVVNYSSGTGTTTLTFNYTVQSGDVSSDLDYTTTGALALNSGTILDGAGNAATLTLASPGAAGSLGANKALVIDGIVPTVSSVSSSTADGTYNISDVIAVTVTFSENVTVTGTPQITLETGTTDRVVNYSSGTGTTTLTFNYTVQSGDVSSDLDYTTTGALALNSGTILDGAGNAATLTLASPGAAGSLGANKALVIDGIVPTVSSVSSSTADGTYNISDVIAVTVTFSENVTVTGTPQITLETGTTDRVVNYSSGTGTTTLTFNYTVQSGDVSSDLDYTTTGALALNSGTILDGAGNAATLTLASPGAAGSLGANKALVIDGVVPTVSSVSSSTANGTYNISDVIAVTVTFSENVTVTGTPQITLETGTTDRVVNYSSGTGTTTLTFNYTVQAGDLSSDLDYTATNSLTAGTSIQDAAGNTANLTLATPGAAGSLGNSKAIVVDGVVPTVSSVSSSTADGTYNISDVIAVTVTFSENVTVTGTPQITLETGTTDRVVDYSSGTGTTTLTFNYTVQSGDVSSDLDYTTTGALALNSGTILDGAGNAATLTLASPGAAGSLGANKALVIDGIVPTVSSVSSSTADGTYNISDVIAVTVTFSENVTVTGTPQITLETGTTDRVVDYSSGTGTSTLTFNYTVQAGDLSADLDYTATSSLTAGTSIQDAAGNTANLTLATPGAAGSLGNSKAIVVDGVVPTVSSVSSSTANGTYNISDVIAVTVTFSENVTVTGIPQITMETGTTDRVVNYSSGTGTTTLTFNYTVQSGDVSSDLDYTTTGALALNSGTILDGAGNAATLTLASPGAAGSLGANKALVIDGVVPTVSSVSSSTANGTYNISDVIAVTVTFSENVTVTGTPQITLETGTTDRVVNYSSGTGTTTLTFNYTVQAGDLSSDLDYTATNSLTAGTSIQDGAGNTASLTLASPGAAGSLGANKAIVIDGVVPTVSSVSSSTPNGTKKLGDIIAVTVVFSENVTVTGTPRITLETGAVDRNVNYSSGSTTNTLTLNYTVQTNDTTLLLDYVGTSSLALNGGTINDAAGNPATLTLATPGAAGSLGANKTIGIDGIVPIISSLTLPSTPLYTLGDNIDFTFNFREPVTVSGGTPYFTMDLFTGGTVNVNYISGSGTNYLLFRYVVALGNKDTSGPDLNNPILPNGATIQDAAGNNATLSFTDVTVSAIDIDATKPNVTSVSVPASATYVAGQYLNFTVNWDRNVTVNTSGGRPYIPIDIGGSIVQAYYLSGSTTSALVFRDTVNLNNLDLDGITVGTAIDLHGGTIRQSTNNADLTLNSVASTTGVLVDAVLPTVSSIGLPANGYYIAGTNLDFTANFSEIVNVAGGTPYMQVTLETGGSVQADYIGGTGTLALNFRYTVVSGNLDVNGITITSPIILDGSTIRDVAFNNATLTFTNGSTAGILVDAVMPGLSSVQIESDNMNDSTYAKSGNTVILTVIANENLSSLSGTIDGKPATPSGSGINWTLSRLTNGTENEGPLSFSISYQDLATNAGADVTATSNASIVTFFDSPPVLSSVTIVSDNVNHPDTAKVGSVITVDFSSSRELDDVVVTIAGHPATSLTHPIGDLTTWTAIYTMVTGDVEGVIPFTIDFKDMPLNIGTQVTHNNFGGNNVIFDKTVPQLNAVSILSDNPHPSIVGTLGIVRLNITASENIDIVGITIASNSADSITHPVNDYKNWSAYYTMVGSETPGNVVFNINYKDFAGNAGTAVSTTTNSSTVTYDNLPPALKTVAPPINISSNNPDPAFAKAGDMVTLTFASAASEEIENVVVTIGTKSATVSTSDNISWTAQYILPSLNGPAEGTLPFTIDFKDFAGNNGTQVTTTTNSSSVTFDKTKPSLTPVTIISNNTTNTSRASTGDTVTVSFTANESLENIDAKIAGNPAVVLNTSGFSWTAKYKMLGTETEGVIPFSLNYDDLSGNSGVQVSVTTNSSSVSYDKTVPTLSNILISSNNPDPTKAKTGNIVTLTFISSESIQPPTVIIEGITASNSNSLNNWTSTITLTGLVPEGNVDFTIDYEDQFGNNGAQTTSTSNGSQVIVDNSNPSISFANLSSNNADTATAKVGDIVTLSFTASEGIKGVSATIGGKTAAVSTDITGKNWTGVYVMKGTDTQGNLAISISFSDSTGNTGTIVTSTSNGSKVKFDKTLPALFPVTIVSNNTNNQKAREGSIVTLAFTANEGIKDVYAEIGGHVTILANNPAARIWTASYTMQAGDNEGLQGISISFQDSTGNVGAIVSNTSNGSSMFYDRTLPTLSNVVIASDNTNTSKAKAGDEITLSFTSSEVIFTPTVTIASKTPNSVSNVSNTWTATYILDGTEAEGNIGFTIDFVDLSYNIGSTVNTTTYGSSVIIDNSIPSLLTVSIASNNAIDNTRAKVGDLVTLSFTSSEAIKDVSATIANKTATISGDGTSTIWTATYNMLNTDVQGILPISILFSDLTGNAGTNVTSITSGNEVRFDRILPTLNPVTISSDNIDSTKAIPGSIVTINFTALEGITQVYAEIGGRTATLGNDISGKVWTATDTMEISDNEGSQNISISFQDSTGNVGSLVTNTTNGSTVIYDRNLPTLSNVAIVSNNANASKAKTGDQVTLSFTSSETIFAPNVKFNGISADQITNISNSWTAKYTITGAESEGNIGFTIDFSDLSYNTGTQVTSTNNSSSVRIDNTLPVVSGVSIASNNAIDVSRAKVGDIVTLTFTSSEGVKAVTAIIDGKTATISSDPGGTSWTATYLMLNSDVQGNVPISIAYSDSASNNGVTVTATNDGSEVVFDRTIPTLSQVTVSSDNSDTTKAILGSVVTINFNSSEGIAGVSAEIGGHTATVVNDLTHTVWSASYTMQASDNEGVQSISISFRDSTGNIGSTVSTTSNGSSVVYDQNIPTLSNVAIVSNNANASKAKTGDQVTLSFTSSETIFAPNVKFNGISADQITNISNNWTAKYTITGAESEGNIGFTIDFSDLSYNTGTQVTSTNNSSSVRIDNTLPVVSGVSIASNNAIDVARAKVGDIVTLTFTSSEGVKGVAVFIDAKAATISANPGGTSWTATYLLLNSDVQGNVPISIAYSDSASNNGVTVTATNDGSEVVFDRTIPTLSQVTVSSDNSDTTKAILGSVVTINFNSSEGIAGVSAEIGGHTATVVNDLTHTVWSASYTMQASDNEGVQSISISFRDSTGNIGSTVSTTSNGSSVVYDQNIPTLSNVAIVSNNANASKAKTGDQVTLSFTSSETIFAPNVKFNGISADLITNVSNNWTAKYTITGAESEGNIGFTIDFSDLSYNTGTQVTSTNNSSSVRIDNTLPVVSGVSIASNNAIDVARAKTGDIVTVSFASDEGLKSVAVSIDGKTASVTGDATGTGWSASYIMLNNDIEGMIPINISYSDSTGNSGLSVTSVSDASSVRFDRTSPSLNYVNIVSENANNQRAKEGDDVTINFTSTEGISNVSAQIGGQLATLINDPSGTVWSAVYTMQITDNEGLQGIIITYRDSSGNIGTTVTATTDASSVTFDRTSPSLFAIAITSDNLNSTKAKTGDIITLTFKSSETVITPTVKFEGFTATSLTGVDNNWTATYLLTGSESDGNVDFTIDYTDISYNPGVQVVSTTNGSLVTIDNMLPELSSVAIASGNPTPNLAKTGDIITLTFASTEAIQNVSVSFDGQVATDLISNTAQTSWTASYQMQPGDNEGLIPILISFADQAGNNGLNVSSTTNGSSVWFDRTEPVLNPVTIASGNSIPSKAKVGDLVTLSFTSSEGIKSVVALIGTRTSILSSDADGKIWTATYTLQNNDPEGEIAIDISFRDSTGNIGTVVSATTNSSKVIFDKSKPTLFAVSIVSGNVNPALTKSGDLISLNFFSSEGIQNVGVSIAGGFAAVTSDISGTIWTATYAMQNGDLEGTVPFLISFRDSVGNLGADVSVTTDNSNVRYDKTIPLISPVSISSNYLNSDKAKTGTIITLDFTSSEPIHNVTAQLLGQAATVTNTSGNTWKAVYTPVGSEIEGLVTISVNYSDLSGNAGANVVSVTDATSVVYDKSTPDLSSIIMASDHTNSDKARIGSAINISFVSTETIEGVSVKINGKTALADTVSANNWLATGYMSSADPVGNVSFTIDFKDLAGNAGLQRTATTNSSSVTFDKVMPGFSSVTIYSNNSDSSYAVAGDTVFLEFVTNESIEMPSIFINGFSPDVISGGPVNWLATRVVSIGENEGIIPFTIDIQDLAGNIANTKFTTTDGSGVTFDDSNPGISSVTVTAGVYKVGDLIPVLIQSDNMNYEGVVVEVNGKNQELINNLNTNYTINYIVEEGDTVISKAGSLPVMITLQDPAGLTTSRSSAISTGGGTISIDTHTPLIGSFSSNAESTGNAIIGDSIIFTLNPVIPEMDLLVKPFSYNNKPLIWTTTDGSEYTAIYQVQEGDDERTVPLQPGQVILSDSAGNADTITYSDIQKNIFTKYPTARIFINGSSQKCDYDSLFVTVNFQFTGRKPFTLTYSNGTDTIVPIIVDAFNMSLKELEGKFTLVNLTDSTGNFVTTALEDAEIEVVALPDITVEYTNSPYNVQSPPDILSQYVTPEERSGGVFYGEGVGFSNGKYNFDPKNIPGGLLDQELDIIYTFTDVNTGCFSKDTSQIFVSSIPVNIVGLEAAYCEDADSVTITGNVPAQHTGLFEVFDANSDPVISSAWSQTDGTSMNLNPKLLPAGSYKLKYTALKLPDLEVTTFYNEKVFIIEPIKTGIEITGLENEYCFDNLAAAIPISVSITPGAGDIGNFFGSDVFAVIPEAHTAKFELSDALSDTSYTINYIYTSATGCVSDTASQSVFVKPLPELSFDLQNNYNYNQGTIPLIGTPAGSTYGFDGDPVINKNALLTSIASTNTPFTIIYSGTDEQGCFNRLSKSTIVYKANESIVGLKSFYCYEDDTIEISCTSSISDTLTGTFTSFRNAVHSTGINTAEYYLREVGGNNYDTVTFSYNILGTAYSVSKVVFVDSIGTVFISEINDDFDYCENEAIVQLTGNQIQQGGQGLFEYDGLSSAFLNKSSTAEIYPSLETPGLYEVKYTYTSKTGSGCKASATQVININPVPVADFEIPLACPVTDDSVHLINKSTPDDETMTWNWTIEGNPTIIDKNPVYKFSSNGTKVVELTVTTGKGCLSTLRKDITIGNIAVADFSWVNDCTTGDSIVFIDNSQGGTRTSYTWKLNEESFPGADEARYKFTEIGKKEVELIISTIDGCSDSITKQVVIQPYIRFQELPGLTYYQDFETNDNLYNWNTKGITDSEISRWNLGTPDGAVINNASGAKSWYTKITDKTNIENSQVVSPCFDLTGLEKPMIKLNIWSSSEFRRDGAVLQYSLDGGINWSNLGDRGEGTNWFNSENIVSTPGGKNGELQLIGWNEIRMEGWTNARHSLDVLKGSTNVRFRIAYASDGGGVSKVDGFAFDDIWIGERRQNILTEYFTNIQSTESKSANEYLNGYEANKAADLVPIHYHTAIPSGDPIYLDYKEGPSSRVFFYGVSQPPLVVSNGTFSSSLNNLDSKTVFESSNDVASLKDPHISFNIQATQSNITVSIMTVNDSLKNKNLVLYAAIVKDSVGVEDEGATTYYYNVLRKFLPNPGGVSLNTADFTAWKTITETIPINIGGTPEFIGSNLVVFVQNTNTREVYQAISLKLTATTSLEPENINMLIDMYPNPAEDYLFIDSQIDIESITIHDISGRIVDQVKPEQRSFSIPVYDLKYGMYIVKGTTRKGEFMKKFIKQ